MAVTRISGDLSVLGTSLTINSVAVPTNSSASTLTNKTIDAASNTISNIADTNISATAGISLSKLAALTTSRALQSNATTGAIEVSSVTNTELGYLSGVTSAIQTQLGSKESTANKGAANGYASLDANSLIPIAQIPPAALERIVTVADQTARFALTTTTVQNGDSVYQTDTATMYMVVDDTNLGNAAGYLVYSAGTSVNFSGSLSGDITGTQGATTYNGVVPILKGGSGQTTANAALNAFLPTQTGNTDKVLKTDGSNTSWASVALSNTGDISQTSFSGAQSAVGANVTGFAFANASVQAFKAFAYVKIDATSPLYEVFEFKAVQKAASWDMAYTSTGDVSSVTFAISNAGQITYDSSTYAGFVSMTIKFSAQVLNV